MIPINWHAVREEAVQHLQALIRIDTSNPPGNELAAAEYVAGVLAGEGLSPRVLKSSPARASVVTRLKGSGERPPLMILGHLDVVPADAGEWSHSPFGGELIDGFVWGRGAIDNKDLVTANLMITLLCHRLGLPLKGDLVCLAHADEESSDFAYGMAWLAREHRDIFDAPYALYEGGGDEIDLAGRRVQSITASEKGWCTVEVTTRGQGGHSSRPHADNPLFHMAPILSRLQAHKMPLHMTRTAADFFTSVASLFEANEPETARLFREMAVPTTAESALARLSVSDLERIWFDALLRSTAAPTMMRGSNSRWALPTEAHLTLNGRVLPGQSAEEYERELRAIVGTDVDMRIEGFQAGIECDLDTPLYHSIQRVMGRRNPDAPLIPILQTGGTERALLHDLGVAVYGFKPFRREANVPPPSQMGHGVDERISIENLMYSLHSLFEIVCDLNAIE